jgi:hypothetical protein
MPEPASCHTTLTSREDVFMDTIFGFDLLKITPDQPDDVININAIEDKKSDKSNWHPQELWVSLFDPHLLNSMFYQMYIQ